MGYNTCVFFICVIKIMAITFDKNSSFNALHDKVQKMYKIDHQIWGGNDHYFVMNPESFYCGHHGLFVNDEDSAKLFCEKLKAQYLMENGTKVLENLKQRVNKYYFENCKDCSDGDIFPHSKYLKAIIDRIFERHYVKTLDEFLYLVYHGNLRFEDYDFIETHKESIELQPMFDFKFEDWFTIERLIWFAICAFCFMVGFII